MILTYYVLYSKLLTLLNTSSTEKVGIPTYGSAVY